MQSPYRQYQYLALSAIIFSIPISSIANSLIYEKDLEKYPEGFAIGGSLGKGYLSAHESNNINDNLPSPPANLTPSISKYYGNGDLIWNAYIAYETLFYDRIVPGFTIGYVSQGQSTGKAQSNAPAALRSGITSTTTSYTYADKQQAIDFLLTGRAYIFNRCKGLHILGKAGAAFVKATDSVDYIGRTSNNSATLPTTATKTFQNTISIWRIEPEIDLGVGYSFSRHLSAHILYTYIGGTDANTSTSASLTTGNNIPWQGVFAYNAVSAGLNWSFG